MGQFAVGLVELVDLLGEGHHALLRVGGFQGGQFDAAHEEPLHLGGVVLVNTLGNDAFHRLAHLVVVQLGVVLAQCLFVFTLLWSMVMLMVFVIFCHNCCL